MKCQIGEIERKGTCVKVTTPSDLRQYFQKMYTDKYKQPQPKITTVPDGIYIHISKEPPAAKLFINLMDYEQNPTFYETYLENADDRIADLIEQKGREK